MVKFVEIYTTGNKSIYVNTFNIVTIYYDKDESVTIISLTDGTSLKTSKHLDDVLVILNR